MKVIAFCVLGFTLVLGASDKSFSQCKEWKWPAAAEQKAQAQQKKTLYENALKNKQFKQAVTPLQWLLTNTPQLHVSLYRNGAELLEVLIGEEKEARKRQVYADSLLLLYDLRIKYCGEAPLITNLKALASFKYHLNTKGRESEVLAVMDKALELNGSNISEATLVPYMQTLMVNQQKHRTFTELQIMERYDKINAILDKRLKKAQAEKKPVNKLKQYKDDIDGILVRMVTIDCDFIKANLAPRFKQNPTDITLAKKIFGFMLQGRCTDDPLWLETGEAIHKAEKDCSLAKNLGFRYLQIGNYDKATLYLKEANQLCLELTDKTDVLIQLGLIQARKENKVAARELYKQALTLNATHKDAYEKIGDLYYASVGDCTKKGNMAANDRLIYLIAYDYYQKAGETKKMGAAKDQFPSREEIAQANYQPGQTVKVDCWIGEFTTIRTRD